MKRPLFLRALTVCLISLMLLASLCLAAGASNTDTHYGTMETILTLNPNTITAEETSARKGTIGDFTWELAGPMPISNRTLGNYTGKTFSVSPGMFKILDTNGTLHENHAVAISADFYFETLPTAAENGATSPDPTSANFEAQLIMAWAGNSNMGTEMSNGIRMDSLGNLYLDGPSTPIGYQISTGEWYNMKIVYSDYTKAEIWINGERIKTITCATRYSSVGFYFFNSKSVFKAHVKNVELSASKDTYYLGTTKEHTSDFISYQTTKPVNNQFDLRVISGINGLDYQTFGYRVLVLTKDASGKVNATELDGTSTSAYSSIYSGSTEYNIKKHFGYDYACLATIKNLDATREHFELVVFPYTLSHEGNKLYGDAISLIYTGQTDANGYPAFTVREDTTFQEVTVSDDTHIYMGERTTAHGSSALLNIRNDNTLGTLGSGLYRAAYLKFTIPAEIANDLDTMANAYLRVHVYGSEPLTGSAANRETVPLNIYGAPTNWTEDTLTFNTFYTQLTNKPVSGITPRGELLDTIPVENLTAKAYLTSPVLDYIKKQTPNADGSITVAFCISQPDGKSNSRLMYLSAKESGSTVAPSLRFETSLYGRSISNIKANNDGYEPIAYSEALLDEWFGGLYDKIYPKDANGNLLTYDIDELNPNGYGATTATGDFSKEVVWADGFLWRRTDSIGTYTDTNEPNWMLKESEWRTDKFARTLSTLGTSAANKFISSSYATETTEYDIYGGIANAGFKGQQTGYFHTETIGGRVYVIDPLGNPYFATSVNAFVYGETDNLIKHSAATYGTEEEFFEKMSAELRDMGIYTTFASDADVILNVENGLSTTVPLFGVGTYMGTLGRAQITEGMYPFGNTINVFDPDFVTTTYEKNSTFILENGYATNPRVFGYTADNELPSHANILESYLLLDPTVPDNTFSYHTAWEWFARRIDSKNPTLMDYYNSEEKEALNSEFQGFIYARNYKTIRESIELVDTNHMYMGSRVAGNCRYDINYLKAAGYYLDVITTNLYDGLNPDPEVMTNYYRYAGKPFIVTEFYAKAMDAIDANGYMMTNSTGAGFVVLTQEARADYYEHFVLSLLESKACVGWSWYRFRDNDQGLWDTVDGLHKNLRMLFVSYGDPTYPVTFIDPEGNVYGPNELGITQSNWKTKLTPSYSGEPMASNQNCNKGIFNTNFSSVVTVYTYENGKRVAYESYEINDQNLATAYPASGTKLTSKDGTKTFTIGETATTKTVLTVYKGKYIALADSIETISDHIMGIVKYLDKDEHIQ